MIILIDQRHEVEEHEQEAAAHDPKNLCEQRRYDRARESVG